MAMPGSKGRIFQLDFLRGIAILLVLGRHSPLDSADAGWLQPFATWWYRFGWTGVDLFFVLSGFLIGSLLFNELQARGSLDVRRFIVRRGLKIWPSYYAFIIVRFLLPLVALGIRTGKWPREAAESLVPRLLPYLLNVQNYFELTIAAHTWSLAVEEHFYLALPLFLLWSTRRQRLSEGRVSTIPGVLWLTSFLIIFCPSARSAIAWHHGLDGPTQRYLHWSSHLRMESLCFGVLLSYLHVYSPEMFGRVAARRGVLLLIGLAAIAPMMFLDLESPFVLTVGLTLLHLGYGAILMAFIATPMESQWWPLRIVAYIGLFSYPIYLWQGFFTDLALVALRRSGWLGVYHAPLPWGIAMPIYIGFATASGILMSGVIERPVLSLRERFYPARARITDHLAL